MHMLRRLIEEPKCGPASLTRGPSRQLFQDYTCLQDWLDIHTHWAQRRNVGLATSCFEVRPRAPAQRRERGDELR